jgi:hypothetical protein
VTGYAFVSHSRVDRAYVQALGAYLRDAGIRLWFDHQLSTGAGLDHVIEQTIDRCVAVIVVLSPDAVASESVNRELAYATDHGKTVIALELAPSEVPAAIAGLAREDVIGGRMPGDATMARLAAMAVYRAGAADAAPLAPPPAMAAPPAAMPAPAVPSPAPAATSPAAAPAPVPAPPSPVPAPSAPPAPPAAVPPAPPAAVSPTPPRRGGALRLAVRVVGVIALLAGLVWTLQGLGVLGGSAMSGQRLWAVVGPVVALVGLVLLVGTRRRRAG